MNDIIIGKHTLESLTSGMYSDPYVVFREYIQNSVDSIDEAIALKIIKKGDDLVKILIDTVGNKISISDNGMGICAEDASRTLISIGNSKKSIETSRGFRGIGRLAALSYCRKLTFETSVQNEDIGTKITIDAVKLSQLLSVSSRKDMSITEVLDDVCIIETYPERASAHYFIVTMFDIDETSGILNVDEVYNYIAQTAPVPYADNCFSFGKEICRRLKHYKYILPQYNVQLHYGSEKKVIVKPYLDTFIVDKNKGIYDDIIDIQLHELKNSDNNTMALAWIAKTNYKGTIADRSIKGLRVRKGNILIGDYQTLNTIFKDARFNGWVIGEIFALDVTLLPNARRDNFEKNSSFFLFSEQLSKLAVNIVKDIRAMSVNRNSELSETINKVQTAKDDALLTITSDSTATQRGLAVKKVKDAQKCLEESIDNNSSDSYLHEIDFEELDILIGRLKGTTSFKALNAISTLTKTEKTILERVLKIIYNTTPIDQANQLVDAILFDASSKH